MIKLQNLLNEYDSVAKQKANALKLVYRGRGNWADQTGTIVAKSTKGGQDLVRLDPAQKAQMSQNNQDPPAHVGQEPMDTDMGHDDTSRDATTRTRPGASNQDNQELYNEPEDSGTEDPGLAGMQVPHPIKKLLHRAGNDAMKLRKALVKKFREGDPKAKVLLDLLDDYEKGEVDSLRKSLDSLKAKKDAALAQRKAKYNTMYPSPQI